MFADTWPMVVCLRVLAAAARDWRGVWGKVLKELGLEASAAL